MSGKTWTKIEMKRAKRSLRLMSNIKQEMELLKSELLGMEFEDEEVIRHSLRLLEGQEKLVAKVQAMVDRQEALQGTQGMGKEPMRVITQIRAGGRPRKRGRTKRTQNDLERLAQ